MKGSAQPLALVLNSPRKDGIIAHHVALLFLQNLNLHLVTILSRSHLTSPGSRESITSDQLKVSVLSYHYGEI